MKPRIKRDATFMVLGFILTFLSFKIPSFYPQNRMLEDMMDFVGVVLMLKGIFLRMVARGHKKEHSRQSQGLVTTGPYAIVRNPMYLGTYLIGAGFVLALWPAWAVVLYTFVFYARFIKQIKFEEKFLKKEFGDEYARYCLKTPRFFPTLKSLRKITRKTTFPWKEALNTKEKQAFVPVLLGVVVFESVKEQMVYGATDIRITLLIVATAVGVFALALWVRYQEK